MISILITRVKNKGELMIKQQIEDFLRQVGSGAIEVYNEFSLQHELGIVLRNKFSDYKVQFERNVSYFGISGTIKKEIDIAIYNNKEKYAIELKYPINGQYPETMFSFTKDIKFVEQLKENGFDKTFTLSIVEDHNFYEGTKKDGIYSFFRDNQPVNGLITKPTGKKDEEFYVNGSYKIKWSQVGKYHYYMVEII